MTPPGSHESELTEVRSQLLRLTQQLRRLEGQHGSDSNRQRPTDARPTKPPTFNGGTNVRTWLWQMSKYFDSLQINSDERRMALADTYLREDAALWRRMQTSPISKWGDWTDMLTRRFAPVNEASEARDTLAQLTQTGSVQQYAYRFQQAALLLADLPQAQLVYQFMRGLKLDVQLQVKLHQPATLERAIRIAYEVDSTVVRLSAKRRLVPTSPRSAMPSKQSKTIHRPQRERLTAEERAYLRENNGCFYCRKLNVPDHIPRCPEAPPRPSKNGYTGSRL